MKLTAKIKLNPTEEQSVALLDTLEIANKAANYISQQAWDSKTFGKFDIQKIVYYDVRESFCLSAQMTIRVIAKVADAYKLDTDTMRTFKPHGAIPLDNRLLTIRPRDQTVSIWTTQGRMKWIPYQAGKRQQELLEGPRGEADLCYINGELYLFVSCEVEVPTPDDITGYMGVDLGIKNIATTDGINFSGSHLNNLRHRHARLRTKLQSKGTKSAKRLLKKRKAREQRFANDINHKISKALVQRAKDTNRGIAMEDLSGIRERVTVRKAQRRLHHSWAFFDLRQKTEYKAAIAGVPFVLVDPRNTSRECPLCGHIDKRNRKTRDQFSCISCGFCGPADDIASVNIGNRANVAEGLPVNQPYAAGEMAKDSSDQLNHRLSLAASPPASAVGS